MRRFLCLYLPRWPLQRLLIERPEWVQRPVALFERSAHGPRLAVCSTEANRLGVKRGMLMADAASLAPDLQLQEIDRSGDRAALEKLALWAGRFSPLVGVEEVPEDSHPQSLLLDISGCAQVFHGERNLLDLALQSLSRKKIKARAAIAATIGAAWALAHFEANATIVPPAEREKRATARRGDEKAQRIDAEREPRTDTGARERGDGENVDVLSPLPLAALRIDREIIAWMHKLGIYKIADLARQPRSTLPSRFGPQLIQRIDQAFGAVSENMPLLRPAPEFHAARAFEYPARSLELLRGIIEKLAAQVCAELQQRCRGVRELECWLYHEVAEPVLVEVTLFKPSAAPEHLLQLLHTRLEDLQLRLQAPSRKSRRPGRKKTRASLPLSEGGGGITLEAEDGICAVALRVLSSETLDAEQLALFTRALRAPENLSLTLDRLRTRLGPRGVLRARIVDDIQPEDAMTLAPLDEPPGPPVQPVEGTRPLQLYTEPLEIEVEWPDQMARPMRFYFQGREILIQRASGPERIETGWWKECSARRDYYVVDSAAGSRYWIFRNLGDERWFVHGVFS